MVFAAENGSGLNLGSALAISPILALIPFSGDAMAASGDFEFTGFAGTSDGSPLNRANVPNVGKPSDDAWYSPHPANVQVRGAPFGPFLVYL